MSFSNGSKTKQEMISYINKYNVDHYETLRANSPREEHLSDQINIAVEKGIANSKQAFILKAIHKLLSENGISSDSIK